MEYIVTQNEMKQYDETTIHRFGMPAMTLMERAALSVILHVQCTDRERILVLCGSGNNGGDGFCVARLLLLAGKRVQVLFTGNREHLSESCKSQWEIYERYAKICGQTEPVVTTWQDASYDIIIDSIFGVGLNRDITGKAAEIIQAANACDAYRIAVDIPSGIDADTGQVHGCAFRADETVTFAFVKRGLLLYPGAIYAGKVHCSQIGITKESFLGNYPRGFSYQKEDLCRLPVRRPDGNKGSFGKIGFFTGSGEIGGAAILSAMAAYRMGSGYVRVFTHDNNKTALMERVTEAVISCYTDDLAKQERLEMMKKTADFADVIAVGAGIGTDEWAMLMVQKLLMADEKPIVVDADACNIIAEDDALKSWLIETAGKRRYPIVMTPHLAEFARLSGTDRKEIQADYPKAAIEFATRFGVILCAKDATTLVTDGEKIYFNRSGNDAMATAGSGDVLFGMTASLLGQKMTAFEGACLSVYIHGLCGDAAKEKTNARYVTASDLVLELAGVLQVPIEHK